MTTPAAIDAIFKRHGIVGPWHPLPSTGVANRIYATRDVVLRVATDHPEAVVDARTESVAAPVAHAAGILTPRLIAFDDSRTIVDRPFSLWERVHGETLGLIELEPRQSEHVWWQVGRELARLHQRVRECPDPQGFLDQPDRELDISVPVKRLMDAGRITRGTATAIEELAQELAPHVPAAAEARFLHHDVHPMNVMCSTDGTLLAILDWGDAGWGDPTLDFAPIPLEAVPAAVQGYESEAPGALGECPGARFAWDKLIGALENAWGHHRPVPVDALRQSLRAWMGYSPRDRRAGLSISWGSRKLPV
jgi:aminoglycoside phosphotransferase (APT) family kinase protein